MEPLTLPKRHHGLARAPWLTKVALWVGAELVVIPVAVIMTTLGHAGPALLKWLLGLVPNAGRLGGG